jgi:Cu2+-containing amine oxidase
MTLCCVFPAVLLQVVSLLAERGYTDLALVAADPWSVHAAPQQLQGRRLIQLFMYGRSR